MSKSNPASETVLQPAPVTGPTYINPREMRLERQGADTVLVSHRFPRIRGGQCELCGTIDSRQPGHLQYKLCPHYRGMEARCSYCPREKDQVEVTRISILNVASHPSDPNTLIMWCNATECGRKHLERFKISR